MEKCSISLGNANQNYNEVSPNTDQNGIVKKSVGSKCREGLEKRDPSLHCYWELKQPLFIGEPYGDSVKN